VGVVTGTATRLNVRERLQLDTAAPELALDFKVRLHRPAAALAATRKHRRVVDDLLCEHPDAAAGVDELVRLPEQRVERFGSDFAGPGIPV
jgi:hypothetical protein